LPQLCETGLDSHPSPATSCAIYEVSPTPAVRRLLWEIHRLRATILAADQLSQRLVETGTAARTDTATQLLVGALQERLRDEPAVQEREALRAETLDLLDGRKRRG
jgi:hypothetical protein